MTLIFKKRVKIEETSIDELTFVIRFIGYLLISRKTFRSSYENYTRFVKVSNDEKYEYRKRKDRG